MLQDMYTTAKSGVSFISGQINRGTNYLGSQQRAFGHFTDSAIAMSKISRGISSGFTGSYASGVSAFTSDGILGKTTRGYANVMRMAEPGMLNFANKINNHLVKQGRGMAGGFSSVGQVISKMPSKHLFNNLVTHSALLAPVDLMMSGKSMTLENLAGSVMNSIPSGIGFELAAGSSSGMFSARGLKGIGTVAGYQMLGEHMGLGPWGSLALQVAGSTYLPGLGWALAGGIGGYQAGKAAYGMFQEVFRAGSKMNRSEFVTGDMSFATAEAATMRQRGIAAIQKSHMNMRSMLGREATLLMGR